MDLTVQAVEKLWVVPFLHMGCNPLPDESSLSDCPGFVVWDFLLRLIRARAIGRFSQHWNC
jgi:hypothetical protein